MAALSYGKRCLKAVLDKNIKNKKRKVTTPEEDCNFWVRSGLDKDGFDVKYVSDYKGFGVFASRYHRKGDFLLQYIGDELTEDEAREREKRLPENMMFYFNFNGKQLW
ncbi:uncharacterized protein LOC130050993 [Ostrea edulis]|uniref:uncharacterized protein LOC130050993 n=1 Tax=Ostrea edulis TaxID=37623 RepID=UPI0024AF4677|nr:uncharacterized protein LOC130050993 [Ostrea edulis]